MQQWRKVKPGKYESESATAELRNKPKRLLVSFTGPIQPAEAVQLVRSAALDFKLECPLAIATRGCEELVKRLRDSLKLGPELRGEVMVNAVPAKVTEPGGGDPKTSRRGDSTQRARSKGCKGRVEVKRGSTPSSDVPPTATSAVSSTPAPATKSSWFPESQDAKGRKFADALVERVKRAKWFVNVGTGQLPDCVRVADWTAAVSELTKSPFVNAATEAVNEIREPVVEGCKARASNWIAEWCEFGKKWEAAISRGRTLAEELTRTAIPPAPVKKRMQEEVARHLRACLMFTFAFAEIFGDEVEHFNRTYVELFLEGYFPCGYRGKYPKGKIVVY